MKHRRMKGGDDRVSLAEWTEAVGSCILPLPLGRPLHSVTLGHPIPSFGVHQRTYSTVSRYLLTTTMWILISRTTPRALSSMTLLGVVCLERLCDLKNVPSSLTRRGRYRHPQRFSRAIYRRLVLLDTPRRGSGLALSFLLLGPVVEATIDCP
ncbi:hypothetical protein BJY04DRAFT_20503 [Aspergillus karnatakaensis]|uniref:uncharacterized protein n=1 Tax=Aspergillus karnatakaensis TaxID=1810916 RepID=UPI003CCD8834